MRNTYRILMFSILLIVLTGCMYPSSQLEKNQTPNQAQLDMVQSAINDYRERTNGLVPIRTKPNETPIFEKYLIDFTMLKERGSISEIPGNAYENGGYYQYAILYPETDAFVKLIDLRITDELRSVNMRINTYRNNNLYPPFGEVIDQKAGLFTIDHEKLRLDSRPTIKSPYSDNLLPIIMDTNGKTYIDYRIDLNDALSEFEHSYKEGDDIRYILAENTPFLPAYSLPYTIKDGEPVFMVE